MSFLGDCSKELASLFCAAVSVSLSVEEARASDD